MRKETSSRTPLPRMQVSYHSETCFVNGQVRRKKRERVFAPDAKVIYQVLFMATDTQCWCASSTRLVPWVRLL